MIRQVVAMRIPTTTGGAKQSGGGIRRYLTLCGRVGRAACINLD
jgi:hypothetical protein